MTAICKSKMRDFYSGSARIFKDNPTIHVYEYVQRFRYSNLHSQSTHVHITNSVANTFKKQKILGKNISVIYLPGPSFLLLGGVYIHFSKRIRSGSNSSNFLSYKHEKLVRKGKLEWNQSFGPAGKKHSLGVRVGRKTKSGYVVTE